MHKDLNLLRLLVVLNEEKQTITAAKRLHVSQPTISETLRKLRDQFDGPLFVRNKNKLDPTLRCVQILEQLPPLLDQLNALYIDDNGWHISKLSGEYSLVFAPPLMSTLGIPIISKLTEKRARGQVLLFALEKLIRKSDIHHKSQLGTVQRRADVDLGKHVSAPLLAIKQNALAIPVRLGLPGKKSHLMKGGEDCGQCVSPGVDISLVAYRLDSRF